MGWRWQGWQNGGTVLHGWVYLFLFVSASILYLNFDKLAIFLYTANRFHPPLTPLTPYPTSHLASIKPLTNNRIRNRIIIRFPIILTFESPLSFGNVESLIIISFNHQIQHLIPTLFITYFKWFILHFLSETIDASMISLYEIWSYLCFIFCCPLLCF